MITRVKSILVIVFVMVASTVTYAQEQASVKFRTRTLFDIGRSSLDKYDSRVYPYFSDLRLGTKVSMGSSSFKMDVGISGSKVSIKDMIFNFEMKDSYISVGNSYEPFSIDMITSSVDLRFNNSANSSQAISTGRTMGVTYYLYPGDYFGAIGVYSDNSVSDFFSPANTSSAIAVTTRQLYRKYRDNNLLQFGGAFSYRTPNTDSNVEPYRVISLAAEGNDGINEEAIIAASIDNVKSHFKTNIELLTVVNDFMAQAEFLHSNISRLDGYNSYRAYGGYIQLSYLFGKGSYGYDYQLAVPTRPTANSYELTTRVDYLNANSEESKIYGGELTSYSIGVNYFLTKSFAVKFNANYIQSHGNSGSNHFTTLLRLQFVI